VVTNRAAVETHPTYPPGTAGRETDKNGLERVPLREEGWQYWKWTCGGEEHNVHYIQEGDEGSPVVLVHGFGAHAYHWRYTIPALAKKHRVYSICLLGYGWSDKPPMQYSGEVWAKQVADFCREVVGAEEEVTLVGNSIGCIACMSAGALLPNLKGLCLLNSAGNLDVEEEVAINLEVLDRIAEAAAERTAMDKLKTAWGRLITQGIFLATKFRIKYFLDKVYLNRDFVDAELVKSIFNPACDPAAPAAFFELSQAGSRTEFTIRGVMKQLSAPMLVLHGTQDPWMAMERAEKFPRIYPQAVVVPIEAGHCPQDDNPQEVNAQLLRFLESL